MKIFSRRSMLAGATLLPFAGPALAAAAGKQVAPPDVPAGEMLDAHIHFFTNDTGHYPVDLRHAREPEEVMRARVMRAPVLPSNMMAMWDRLGIGGAVGVQYSGAYKADNSYVLDVADANPKRIGTEIILSSADPDSPALLARLADKRRVSAIRLTGFVDNDGDLPWLKTPVAMKLWAMAQERRLPVGITYLRMDPRPAAFETIRRFSDQFPGATIVLEHLGWLGGANSKDGLLPEHMALIDHRNVYFKWTTLNIDALCNAGIAPADFLRAAVDSFGASRLMWGSDFGNTTRPYAGIVADAHDATRLLNAREAAAVLGGSAHTLYHL